MRKPAFGFLALATALAIVPGALASPLIVGTFGVAGGSEQWSLTGITFTNTAATERDATGNFGTVLGVSPATTPSTIDNSPFTFLTPDGLFLVRTPGAPHLPSPARSTSCWITVSSWTSLAQEL